MAKNQRVSVRVRVAPAILNYEHLFSPWTGPKGDQTPTFSAQLVFTEENQKHPGYKELLKAIATVGRQAFGENYKQRIQDGEVRSPIRRGNAEKGHPEGSTFINARRRADFGAPGIVANEKGDDGKPRVITADDQVAGSPYEVYSGAIVLAVVSVYNYTDPTPGIAIGLEALQKIGDGPRLDNRVNPQDVFEVESVSDESDESLFDLP